MEMVGNLTENAMKWARTQIVVSGRRLDNGDVCCRSATMGPGFRRKRSSRSDTRREAGPERPGNGLGLGIVRDLCELYGGELILGRSDMGGLCATLQFPASRAS